MNKGFARLDDCVTAAVYELPVPGTAVSHVITVVTNATDGDITVAAINAAIPHDVITEIGGVLSIAKSLSSFDLGGAVSARTVSIAGGYSPLLFTDALSPMQQTIAAEDVATTGTTGQVTISDVVASAAAVNETVTITALAGAPSTTFSVVGSVSGVIEASITFGAYSANGLAFTLTDVGTNATAGATWTFTIDNTYSIFVTSIGV